MCNCKSGKSRPINNLKDQYILKDVQEVFNRLIEGNDVENLSDLDWMELYQTWSMVYPNSTGTPSKTRVIDDLRNSLQFLKVKTVKR